MEVTIITPDKVIFDSKAETAHVKLIQLPGIDGSFEIMKDHAPLISVLKKGNIRIVMIEGKNPDPFPVNGGVVEVLNNKVLILAD